jgi:hypothetical protein
MLGCEEASSYGELSAIGNSKRRELNLDERWDAWQHSDGVIWIYQVVIRRATTF